MTVAASDFGFTASSSCLSVLTMASALTTCFEFVERKNTSDN